MRVNKDRDVALDLAKFVAMFMVIYGHVMSYRPGFDLAVSPSYAENFIIPLNMPLFFIISGHFSHGLHEGGSWTKLLNRMISYFWPMAFFALFFTCFEGLVLAKYTMTEIPVKIIKNTLFTSWFFQALAICEVITFIAYRFKKRWMRGACCSIGVLLCLLSAGRIWYVGSVFPMILFYWFGLFILPYIVVNRHLYVTTALLGCVGVIGATFFYGNVATNGLSFYTDKIDIYHPTVHNIISQVLRFIVGSAGGLFIIWLLRMLLKRWQGINCLAVFGTETLGMYFLQGWLIHFLVAPFISLEAGVGVLFAASSGVFAGAFIIVRLLKMNPLLKHVAFGWRI